jgi:MoaA/NifB/PqqE/SkfB family radical SAM enzyme
MNELLDPAVTRYYALDDNLQDEFRTPCGAFRPIEYLMAQLQKAHTPASKFRLGPDGLHLFDRSTGLNLLLDEIHLPESHWHRAPRQVSIALTNACDLTCVHCYAPKVPAHLKQTDIERWAQELDENGCLGIGFGGGEPTLHKDFAAICSFVSQNTTLAVTATTHGHRLSRVIADELAGHVNFIRLSMDGIGDTYERLRGRSFTEFIEKIEIAKSISPVGLNVVVNNETIGDLNRIVDFAEKRAVRELLLLPQVPTARAAGIERTTLSALSEWVNAYRGPVPLCISETSCADMPVLNPLSKERGVRAYVHIDAFGTIKRTSFELRGVTIGSHKLVDAMELIEQNSIQVAL